MLDDILNCIFFGGEFIAVFTVLFIGLYYMLGRYQKITKEKRAAISIAVAAAAGGLWIWLILTAGSVLLWPLPVVTCTVTVLELVFYRLWKKRIVPSVLSTLAGVVILFYLAVGFLGGKPGMNGFEVTNGVVRMMVTGQDYVRVRENRYLYKPGNLSQLIENEYDSFRFDEDKYKSPYDNFAEEDESTILKVGIVSKNGQDFEAHGVEVGIWSAITGKSIQSLYYAPCE